MRGCVLAIRVLCCVALVLVMACGSSGAGGGGGSGNGGAACHALKGMGASMECTWAGDSNIPNWECPYGTSGSCPATGLAGCCVTASSSGGFSETTAVCVYDSTNAATARTNCNIGTGIPCATTTWTTTAP
jgi:hypothetical protein